MIRHHQIEQSQRGEERHPGHIEPAPDAGGQRDLFIERRLNQIFSESKLCNRRRRTAIHTICASVAAIVTAVAAKMPHSLNARKKSSSGKRSNRNFMFFIL